MNVFHSGDSSENSIFCDKLIKNIKSKTNESDILVTCIGKNPKIIDESYVKKNSIIIDVGTNVNINEFNEKEICGDVNLENVINKVKYITPKPGGVGKITGIMLIRNVIKSWYRSGMVEVINSTKQGSRI